MKKAFALVEGQTEETFVRDTLQEHFEALGLLLVPIIISTKRTKSGIKFKGGIQRFARVRSEVRNLLADSSASFVTTMIDYYGLPEDFPHLDKAKRSGKTPRERVQAVEDAFRRDIDHPRFLPYLSLHEFEALLFCGLPVLGEVLQAPSILPALESVTETFVSPEEIDDGPETHPSARILALTPGYRKPLHGPRAARRIGLKALRARCPHFDAWISRLEAEAAR